MGLDFKAANAALLRDVRGFCKKYLPKGTEKGDWWLAPVPWRVDRNPSFVVSLTTGRWRDLALDERGDLLDLAARLQNKPVAEIVRGLV